MIGESWRGDTLIAHLLLETAPQSTYSDQNQSGGSNHRSNESLITGT